MNAELLLLKLDGVRKRQSNQWSAKCPAHDDGSPSLSIRENSDGRILLHCFGGCHTRDVVEALGVSLEDLFPPNADRAPMERRSLITASQALEMLEGEALIVATAAGNVSNGIRLTAQDRQRVFAAAGRIAFLRSQISV